MASLLAAHDEPHPVATALDVQTMEQHYQALKAGVLAAAAAGTLPLADMEALLGRYSALRRAVQQALKARSRLHVQTAG